MTLLRDRPLAFVDTETTGLDAVQNEVIELAVIVCSPDGTHVVEEFHTKVRPVRLETASPKALEINGYAANPQSWAYAPTFEDIVERVGQTLVDVLWVGQNPSFDIGFLREAFKRCRREFKAGYHAIDTITLAAEHLVPLGLDRLNLVAIAKFLNINHPPAHSALVDAHLCRQVYLKLMRASMLDRILWGLRAPRRA